MPTIKRIKIFTYECGDPSEVYIFYNSGNVRMYREMTMPRTALEFINRATVTREFYNRTSNILPNDAVTIWTYTI